MREEKKKRERRRGRGQQRDREGESNREIERRAHQREFNLVQVREIERMREELIDK